MASRKPARLCAVPGRVIFPADRYLDVTVRLLPRDEKFFDLFTAVATLTVEAARLQQEIDRQGGGFKLAPWDWQYYAEQVRKAEYDLDESQIRPYFEMDRVLQDGVFYADELLLKCPTRYEEALPSQAAPVSGN